MTNNPESRVSTYWIQDLLSRNRGALGAALGFSLILSLFGLLSPQFIGMLYREIDSVSDPQGLVALGAGALLFALGEVVFLALRQTLIENMKVKFMGVLDRQILRRILGFPLALSLSSSPATQWARIKEFEDLATQLSRPVTRALLDFPFMGILIVALGFTGGAMVLVPLVTILVFLLLGFFVYPLVRKLEQEAAAEGQQVQTRLDAVLDNGTEMQLWGIEERWKANLQKAELAALPALLKRNQLVATFNHISNGLVSLAGVLAVLAGVEEVLAGRLEGGALLASMMLVWRILDPFRSIFVLLGSIQSAVQTAKRLQRFMAIQGDTQPDPSRPPLRIQNPSVRVEGFYFKYPQASRFTLANVTFDLPAHASLQVLGTPGSGRSTLALAILGMVEGSNGRITIGDQNIKQYSPVSLRKNIGFLPASVPVLPLTLADNLRLARADASDQDLQRALDEVGLDLALDTVLDRTFVSPDPDFPQALGLARLCLREAPLWILDTPEDSLMPVRRERLETILKQRQGLITLMILSNDPSFSGLCRYQAQMDEGRFQMLRFRDLKTKKVGP